MLHTCSLDKDVSGNERREKAEEAWASSSIRNCIALRTILKPVKEPKEPAPEEPAPAPKAKAKAKATAKAKSKSRPGKKTAKDEEPEEPELEPKKKLRRKK